MESIDYMMANGHQQLAVWTDPDAGLKAFIAIHDTTLGPALGGTRIWKHPSDEEALMDVLRLARAMTYKSAAAGLPLGGGKGLILADRSEKTEAMLRSYGRFVDTLGGRYITTEDVGATAQDMEWVLRETNYVVGLPEELGGSGNPAVVTGFGVYQAMRAAADRVWGSPDLAGRTVAMQGFGNAASSLAGHLREAGARLVVTDISKDALGRARELEGVHIVAPSDILGVECDIFAPCALGGTVDEAAVASLRCQVVCGAANNQLATPEDGDRLRQRGIVYVPDFIANAGGVINVSYEMGQPYDRAGAMAKTAEIYDTVTAILRMSDEQDITTARAAGLLAEERIAAGRAAPRD